MQRAPLANVTCIRILAWCHKWIEYRLLILVLVPWVFSWVFKFSSLQKKTTTTLELDLDRRELVVCFIKQWNWNCPSFHRTSTSFTIPLLLSIRCLQLNKTCRLEGGSGWTSPSGQRGFWAEQRSRSNLSSPQVQVYVPWRHLWYATGLWYR